MAWDCLYLYCVGRLFGAISALAPLEAASEKVALQVAGSREDALPSLGGRNSIASDRLDRQLTASNCLYLYCVSRLFGAMSAPAPLEAAAENVTMQVAGSLEDALPSPSRHISIEADRLDWQQTASDCLYL